MSSTPRPSVSVVLCTYDSDLYDHFIQAAQSILDQTYPNVELVVIIDGTATIYDRALEVFEDDDRVVLEMNETNRGLSASRNRGVELATGDIVAFIDDDAVARPDWIEHLVETYDRREAIAAGGRMAPRWMTEPPNYLPSEFYWLIGVTHDGYPETESEVRNTFGSNISFRREVLVELGGFDESFGLRADSKIQSEETEFCARMWEEFRQGVWYNPAAVVEHKIFAGRTRYRWLWSRAFWQGVTKARFERETTARGVATETDYLTDVVFRGIVGRLKAIASGNIDSNLGQLWGLVFFTTATGLGYVYGRVNF